VRCEQPLFRLREKGRHRGAALGLGVLARAPARDPSTALSARTERSARASTPFQARRELGAARVCRACRRNPDLSERLLQVLDAGRAPGGVEFVPHGLKPLQAGEASQSSYA